MKTSIFKLLAVLLVMALTVLTIPVNVADAASYELYETSKSNVPVWSQSSSKSTKLRTITDQGTIVKVAKFEMNSAGNRWAKLNTGEYIYAGNLIQHVHNACSLSTTTTYSQKSDTMHTRTDNTADIKCRCGEVLTRAKSSSYDESHAFENGVCTKCAVGQVSSAQGYYVTAKENVPIWTESSSSSSKRFVITNKWTPVMIMSVTINGAGNYWGKIPDGGWIYMGNLLGMQTAMSTADVFLKQEQSDTCTLCSVTMMLRRYAIFNGENYQSITEGAVRSAAWGSSGLKGTFTYNGVKVTYLSPERDKRAMLIRLLSEHPEGVVIYDFGKPHAVLLIEYDQASDIFYVADPSSAAGSGKIPLADAKTYGSGQEGKIAEIDKLWYIP